MIQCLGIGGAWKSALTARGIRPRPPALRFVLTLLVTAGMLFPDGLHGRAARGQDDWDVAKKAVDQPVQRGMIVLPNFDQWVLGGKPFDQVQRTVKSLLALQVESVARACELSGAQREKLQLAGEGDLKRLSRSIDELRERFREVGQDQQKFNNIAPEVSSVQMKLQSGIYDDSSLFHKVLRQTLNREQSVRYERQERERRKFRYEAKIELVLLNLENSISLRAQQRQRLTKLLLDETEPPKKFGQYDYYFVVFQAGRLGEAKLKSILDDAQWQSLKKVLDQFRGWEGILRSQGYLPETERGAAVRGGGMF
ncbi:MAG: hypothetical protein ACLP9L_26975 [Thermoguttaceae bacterium]